MTSSTRPNSSYLVSFLVIILIGVLTIGCSSQTDRMWLKAPDWSRAQFVGATAIGDRPVFALAPDGSATFILVANQNGRTYPQMVSFGPQGQRLWQTQYADISMARPDQARVYWADGALHAFWLSNESLYHLRINPTNGEMLAAPRKLSADIRVGNYAVAVKDGEEMTLWFAGPRVAPGLYRLQNNLSGSPLLIDEQGVRPTLAFDASGELHALWARYPMGQPKVTIIYAAHARSELTPKDFHIVATPKAALGSLFVGPSMGLTADTAYIFWDVEIRTGVAAGSVDARYVTFPLAAPQNVSDPTQLFVPADYHLSYEKWLQEGFRAGRRARLAAPRTGKVTQIYPHSSSLPELATTQRALTQFTMRDNAYQVGVLFFSAQKPTSYQLLSFTGGDSRSPYLTSDAEHWLYASWLERGEPDGFRIMYASTNPTIKTAYDALSVEDFKTLSAQTAFGLISSALLFPFILMWMIAPLVLYLITFPLRRHRDTSISAGVIISLGISLAGYWVLKLGFLGGIKNYVPFSAWLPIIPEGLALPLQLLVPALIFVISLVVAWLLTYKRQNPSSLLFLVLYLAVDGLLSAAIYGPLILATN